MFFERKGMFVALCTISDRFCITCTHYADVIETRF